MRIILAQLLLLLSMGLMASSNTTAINITNLTCERFDNPLGVDVLQPRLSWQLKSDKRNVTQTSYRIIVSDDRKKIKAGEGNIWDSQKVNSDQSILIVYNGKPLQSSSIYYWKVMVWSADGSASDWSQIADWQMGLLSPNDWDKAQWIGYENLSDSLRGLKKSVVPLFRKEFDANKKIASVTLFISGLGQYEAYINGTKAGNSFFAPGWTNYNQTVLYNTYDVTHAVNKGKNVIGAIVGNGFYYINREPGRFRKLETTYGMPKLICKLKIIFTDGSQTSIVSDNSWKTAASAITFSSIYGGEDYDAQLEQKGCLSGRQKWQKYKNFSSFPPCQALTWRRRESP